MRHCNILDKEDVKKKTVEALRRAKDANREHGFNICSANGRVVSTYVEGGEKDSVGIGGVCPKGAKIIGALHVHTKSSSSKDVIPSPTDIKKSIVENMAFFCIGTNIENQGIVRCFSKEDLESEMVSFLRNDKNDKKDKKDRNDKKDKKDRNDKKDKKDRNDKKDKKDKLEMFGIKTEDVDRSTRLIVGRMSMYEDYLNKHSCQRIL